MFLKEEKENLLIKNCKERISLRGFLECNRCGERITVSAPKGNGGVYYYYHCKTKCGERFRTDVAHEALLKELGKITIKHSYIDLFEQILKITIKET